ncbi:RNA polymerase recycling motor ATPase HelR [Microbacterium sp. X-17]|uniref:RNA polymerase recycling motor ATPase HelR n=1 Tax=Microbacterium sp. X-17 TaxID=3144404 RepID=UPI0031F57627
MTPLTTTVFDLGSRRAAKADPRLVARDETQFAAIAATLQEDAARLARRLDELRLIPAEGQTAVERDSDIRRLAAQQRLMQRFGIDLCLGRMVAAGDPEAAYIGRIGLTDRDGRRLLVDWRAPAAEPFFGATHANPMGLVSRRRYRWTGRRVSDYWDEVFAPEGFAEGVSPDDDSAFIASLGTSRSSRMRDVLSTIQADQDAIIRAGSPGALVVDGGPGTGKTVVALHRAAYLLYAEPHLTRGGGGVLFVGPTDAYLAYVDDVLPSLGEESVRICTLRDLVPEGAAAGTEPDPRVARLKESIDVVAAVDRATRYYEDPPRRRLAIETPWGVVVAGPDDWAEAFGSADPAASHDDARDQVWNALLELLLDQLDDEDLPRAQVRRWLAREEELAGTFRRAWPLLDPVAVVADLWTVPEYLRYCVPSLSADEVALLQRADARAWTTSDLPWLDAARQRIGDPEASRRQRQNEAARAAERELRERVTEDLIAADDSDLKLMSILRGQDARNSLDDDAETPRLDPDALAGPFAHVIVDEAQELTDAEWRMLLRRCPSRSFTIVGDRAQARHGFPESWEARLARVGLASVRVAGLTINYRTPAEVMAEAAPVIRAALPDANVPTSIREGGRPVRHAAIADRDAILATWLAEHPEGVACVIGDPAFAGMPRVRALTPVTAKGLEFDLVVLVAPDTWGAGVEAGVDRYVAMTRATSELVLLS